MPLQVSMRETTDETYIAKTSANFNTILKLLLQPEKSKLDTTHNENQDKLPTIKLPTFSGKYQDWKPFSTTFQTLIHTKANLSMC